MLQYLAQAPVWRPKMPWFADKVAQQPDDPAAAFSLPRAPFTHARTQIMARVYGEFYHARGVTAELRDMAVGGRTNEQALDGIAGFTVGRSHRGRFVT